MAVFGGSVFCLITGASKGIGRGIAVQLADVVGENSLLVLCARSDEGLQETKRLIETKRRRGIDVRTVIADLSNMDSLTQTISSLFDHGVDPGKFAHAVLINNAGSLGDVTKTVGDLKSPDELQNYFGFNVTSAVCLTSKFLEIFPGSEGRRRTILNISSLCAVKPFAYTSIYCASRAARDMIFQVLACENPSLRILNYAPGPVDTDMQRNLRENLGDPQMKKAYNDLKAQGNILSAEETCKVLLKVLQEDTYESGSHLDYYDVKTL